MISIGKTFPELPIAEFLAELIVISRVLASLSVIIIILIVI
jgi:hypothetical protein